MYAVFQSGGKQHRVSEGQTVRLEKLDIATGETVEFAEVLMIANGEEVKIGVPFVDGGVIKAEVVAHGRGVKSLSFVVVNTIVSSRAIVSGSLM